MLNPDASMQAQSAPWLAWRTISRRAEMISIRGWWPTLACLGLFIFAIAAAAKGGGWTTWSPVLVGSSGAMQFAMAVVTWKVLDDRIAAGRGQGHGDAYLPWLWIHRKNVSGRGNQVVDPMPGYRRASHFLAQVEWHVGLLCIYLGALDVREQFPLWPQPHPHPLADYAPSQQGWSCCRGLIAISQELGVDHGREVGSDAPYVATIDIAATVKRATGYGIAGIALKPHELILSSEPTDRINERLAMERVCMTDYGATHKVVDRSLLGHSTGGNLELLSSGARLPERLQDKAMLSEFKERFIDAATLTSISRGIDRTGAAMDLNPMDANLVWRHLTWHRRIELDITLPIQMGIPLTLGGSKIADALTRELFGEVVP